MARDSELIERVRGTNDLLPPKRSAMMMVEDRLRAVFQSAGYRPIEVPVIEEAELFLRKSGQEIAARLFALEYRNRRICLRPEFTASVMRAYVNELQEYPLPLRLYYSGPAFRYEKPQRGRYRQFTQLGVELIGSASPLADAEVLALACQGVEAIGLSDYRVVIGHLSIVRDLLRQLGLDQRLQGYFLESLDRLGKPGYSRAAVLQRLGDLYPSLIRGGGDGIDPQLRQTLARLDEGEARGLVEELLRTMGPQTVVGGRSATEIAERLVAKIRLGDQTQIVERALDLIEALKRLHGHPPEVFLGINDFLRQHDLSLLPLEQLTLLWETLETAGLTPERVTIDVGLGRGLAYYTGAIFELYHESLGAQSQIGGGGRYDELIAALGGREAVPACGFAYGVERLLLALEAEGNGAVPQLAPDVLVLPLGQKHRGSAALVADVLRRLGLSVEVEVRERAVRASTRYATKVGIRFLVFVGEEEESTETMVIRDLESSQERRLSVQELGKFLREWRGWT
ncbi:MAG: ATP phosphoribosyltransferase regulatory subunit [Chloroflexi bacterium]|nr:ATP phosphoribosyltransferase regulatory subunit [Chloroflexota bacterium]